VQQSPFRVQLEFTGRHAPVHWIAGPHARPPPTNGAQQPLVHWPSAVQESAQRPLTQKPRPCLNEQQSPFAEQTSPVPTHAGPDGVAVTQLSPVTVYPGSHAQRGLPAVATQSP
jgi:hypothetical protein